MSNRILDEHEREAARRALLGLPEEPTPQGQPVQTQAPTTIESANQLSTEEAQLREATYAVYGNTSLDTPTSNQQETEDTLTEKASSKAPTTRDGDEFYQTKQSQETSKSSDQYREKILVSDYEVQKAAPIQLREEQQTVKKSTSPSIPATEMLRTLKTDTREILSKENVTIAKLAARTLDQRDKRKKEAKPHNHTRAKRMGAIILLVCAIVFCTFALVRVYLGTRTVNTPPRSEETRETLEISASSLSDLTKRISTLSSTEPEAIVLSLVSEEGERVATLPEALEFIGLTPSRTLSQTLSGKYAIGAHTQTPFVIFEVSSFEYTFAGLIEWEQSLASELSSFFTFSPNPFVEYRDLTISNIDMRIAEDQTGEVLFAYAILNEDYVLIAKTPKLLASIAPHAETTVNSNVLD